MKCRTKYIWKLGCRDTFSCKNDAWLKCQNVTMPYDDKLYKQEAPISSRWESVTFVKSMTQYMASGHTHFAPVMCLP